MFRRSRVRPPVFLLLLLSLGITSASAGSNVTDEGSVESDNSASVWTNTIFDPNRMEMQGALNTQAGAAKDGRQEPILVPLPAPILAAGTGIGLAWILRKRMTRS